MLPTDTGGSTTAQGTATLSRIAAGYLASSIAGSARDALGFGTNVTVALLVTVPAYDATTGTYSITSAEANTTTHPGYARITVPRSSGFTGPYAQSPVTVSNLVQATSPTATADWAAVNAFALIDSTGAVITWQSLATALYVKSGEQARIPSGALVFAVPSA